MRSRKWSRQIEAQVFCVFVEETLQERGDRANEAAGGRELPVEYFYSCHQEYTFEGTAFCRGC